MTRTELYEQNESLHNELAHLKSVLPFLPEDFGFMPVKKENDMGMMITDHYELLSPLTTLRRNTEIEGQWMIFTEDARFIRIKLPDHKSAQIILQALDVIGEHKGDVIAAFDIPTDQVEAAKNVTMEEIERDLEKEGLTLTEVITGKRNGDSC